MDTPKINTLFNYIGGKTWLKAQLNEEIKKLLSQNNPDKPDYIDTYCEPFAGGLGAFLNVAATLKGCHIKKVIINDVNTKLIHFYTCVNNSQPELLRAYEELENRFQASIPAAALTLHKTKEKEALKKLLAAANAVYQDIRKDFNTSVSSISMASTSVLTIKTAAQLLFLQNHCFNGVYRENSKGEYNTPFNWEAKNFGQDNLKKKIEAVHQVFQQFETVFSHKSFADLDYNQHTLYYADPPYFNDSLAPENKYHKDFFDMTKQELLLEKLKNHKFLYSNHDSALLLEKIQSIVGAGVEIQKIPRKNIISATVASRQNDKIELLVSKN